jgi:16S rRNA (cytidine1402-2'-O)-methyltransferase
MAETHTGCLYLVPTGLVDGILPAEYLPSPVLEIVNRLDYLLVENAKSARAFLRAAGVTRPLQEIVLCYIGKHADRTLRDY